MWKCKNKTTQQDSVVQETTHPSVTKKKKSPTRIGVDSSAEKEQQHCQVNFILTLLQRLNLLSHCISPPLTGPVGYLLLNLPASPLPPRSAHIVSRLCQYRVEYTYSVARWQIIFYWVWNPLTRQRKWRGGERTGKYWRDRAGQWMREKEMGEWGGSWCCAACQLA